MGKLSAFELRKLARLKGDAAAAHLFELGGPSQIADDLGSSETAGIPATEDDIKTRKKLYGTNRSKPPKSPSFFRLFINAIKDITLFMVVLNSFLSAVVVFIQKTEDVSHLSARHLDKEELTEYQYKYETTIIVCVLLIIFMSALIDNAKHSKISWLYNYIEKVHRITVIRKGQQLNLPKADILVGDICLLKIGDVIPAGGIVIKAYGLKVDESPVTGDDAHFSKGPADPVVLAGSTVVEGSGQMIAIVVGSTFPYMKPQNEGFQEPWRRQQHLQKISEANMRKDKLLYYSDLQNKVFKFYSEISCFGALMAMLTLAVLVGQQLITIYVDGETWNNDEIRHLIISIALAVTVLAIAVPKSLPLASTLALAFSLKEMVRDHILLHHLDTCETMGNVNVICTGKTGSLTLNRRQVCRSYICENWYYKTPDFYSIPDPIGNIITHAIALNTMYSSRLLFPRTWGSHPIYEGDYTECALLRFVHELGRSYQAIRDAYPLDVFPKIYHFTSDRKYMMTAVPRKTGGFRVFVKGAPEVVLKRCQYYSSSGGNLEDFGNTARARFKTEVLDEMTNEGLSTLAIAYRDFVYENAKYNQTLVSEPPDWENEDMIFANLTVLCIMGIVNPLRPEAASAVARCRKAGIFICLMTGESVSRAKSIADKCGLLKKRNDMIMEAAEFDNLIRDSSGQVQQSLVDSIWPYLRVVARCSSIDKHHIVMGIANSLADEGQQTVAVVGKGPADILALADSDVSFAKNFAAASAVKRISDAIVLNDSIDTVIKAIKWGSNLHDNVARFIQFHLTLSIVIVVFVYLSSCALERSPLNVAQLLWLNIIIDIFGLASLTAECPDSKSPVQRRRPLSTSLPLVSQTMIKNIFFQIIFQLVIIFYLLFEGELALDIALGTYSEQPSKHLTMVFNTLVLMSLFNQLNSRKICGECNVFSNLSRNNVFITTWLLCFAAQVCIIEYGSDFFGVKPLDIEQWLWAVFIGLSTMIWAQITILIPNNIIPQSLIVYGAETPLTKKEWKLFQTVSMIRGFDRIKKEVDPIADGSQRKGTVQFLG